jgi:excisionase family DNA binding protein
MKSRPDPSQWQHIVDELQGFVTAAEAAELLGVEKPAIYARVRHQTLLAVKAANGAILIPREEIERVQHTYWPDNADAELADV